MIRFLPALVLWLPVITTLEAQTASADLSFDTDGFTQNQPAVTFWDVQVRPNQKIVAVGDSMAEGFFVAQFHEDGRPDSSFAGRGVARIPFDVITLAEAKGVIIQPDENVVVVGIHHDPFNDDHDIALCRLKPDGTLDSSFGTNGKVLTNILNNDNGFAVALEPGGKILVAATSDSWFHTNKGTIALLRYNANGTLDQSFGTNGIHLDTLQGSKASVYQLAVQSGGEILMASARSGEFVLSRFTGSGTLDASFASSGRFITNFGDTGARAMDLLIQPDGKIVAGGTYVDQSSSEIIPVMLRFSAQGILDAGFGQAGIVHSLQRPAEDYPLTVGYLPTGHLVVITRDSLPTTGPGTSQITAFSSNGLHEASFAAGTGHDLLPGFGPHFEGRNSTIDPAGRIVVCGSAGPYASLARVVGGTSGLRNMASSGFQPELYPMPAASFVWLRGESPWSNAVVHVVDLHGRRLQSSPVQSASAEVRVALPPNLPNGVYFLQVTTEAGPTMLPMTIQR